MQGSRTYRIVEIIWSKFWPNSSNGTAWRPDARAASLALKMIVQNSTGASPTTTPLVLSSLPRVSLTSKRSGKTYDIISLDVYPWKPRLKQSARRWYAWLKRPAHPTWPFVPKANCAKLSPRTIMAGRNLTATICSNFTSLSSFLWREDGSCNPVSYPIRWCCFAVALCFLSHQQSIESLNPCPAHHGLQVEKFIPNPNTETIRFF